MSNREQMKQALKQLDFSVYEGRDHLQVKGDLPKTNTHVGVVFLGSDVNLEESLAGIKAWQASKIDLTFIFSNAAMEVLKPAQLIKRHRPNRAFSGNGELGCEPLDAASREALINTFDIVYVPNLTQNTTAKLALGIQDDLVSNLLWHALAKGKKVYANAAGILSPSCIGGCELSAMMKKTMKGHLETIKQYGVVLEIPDLAGAAIEKSVKLKKLQNCVILSDDVAKKVITERHILSLTAGSQLALRKGVKVTPLAREAARKRQIELMQMEEGNNL